MKKFTAIFFSIILLFYSAGYRWLFNVLEQKATAKLDLRIDAGDYSENELIEIKIPLSMPYYSDKDYEEVYGETDWNGNHYQYVKRKVEGNTLVLLCLPNFEKNAIAAVKKDLTKNISDFSSSNSSNHKNAPSVLKVTLSDFESNQINFSQYTTYNLGKRIKTVNDDLNSLFNPLTPAQPPEFI